jgi:hypothetical protein
MSQAFLKFIIVIIIIIIIIIHPFVSEDEGCLSEIFVSTYKSTWFYKPEDLHKYIHCCKNFRSLTKKGPFRNDIYGFKHRAEFHPKFVHITTNYRHFQML